MELQSQGDTGYEFITGSTIRPWYRNKKIMIPAVLLVIAFTAVALAIVFIKPLKKEDIISEVVENLKDIPPVAWDGNCPLITASSCPSGFESPPLLLLSMDSFRPDYLDNRFPTLTKLSRCGVRAEYLISVYPTKTFPNHYSIVTGVFPAWHGIIDNYMFDPVTNKSFQIGKPASMEPQWWSADPIWVTATRQGKKAATFFWPGSDVEINGTRPTYYKEYDTNVPFETRVDQVLKWLDLPSPERPELLTLYFNEPDTAAHEHGTRSPVTEAAISRVDAMVSRLMAGLQMRNLTDCVNILFVSDHGMANIDCNRTIDLDDYANTTNVIAVTGAFGRVRLKEGSNTTEQDLLTSLRCRNEHMRAYRKEELPVRSHYVLNQRIEPLVVDIDSGRSLTWRSDPRRRNRSCTGGNHGYDNLYQDMRATFFSLGPSLKRNATVKPFLNIELYELMAELIGIVPNPNNGTKGSLYHLLKSPPDVKELNDTKSDMFYDVGSLVIGGDPKAANCPCASPQNEIGAAKKASLQTYHLPFGVPRPPSSNNSSPLLLLHNTDFVSAFSTRLRMPFWTSYTLRRDCSLEEVEDICWRGDARLPVDGTAKCSDYDDQKELVQRPLYPPEFSNSTSRDEALLVSNSVPKSGKHAFVLESEMLALLQNWTREGSPVNVITGLAFHPPGREITVPTHYFLVATLCSQQVEDLKDCKPALLTSRTVLLPNRPFPDNCELPVRIIGRNSARVADVEYLTGLRFFTSLPPPQSARLRTAPPNEWVTI